MPPILHYILILEEKEWKDIRECVWAMYDKFDDEYFETHNEDARKMKEYYFKLIQKISQAELKYGFIDEE